MLDAQHAAPSRAARRLEALQAADAAAAAAAMQVYPAHAAALAAAAAGAAQHAGGGPRTSGPRRDSRASGAARRLRAQVMTPTRPLSTVLSMRMRNIFSTINDE